MMARRVLARNILALRRSLGWSQERLAQECGLHRTYIGGIERGERNVSIDNIERIAQALRVTLAELVSHRQEQPNG